MQKNSSHKQIHILQRSRLVTLKWCLLITAWCRRKFPEKLPEETGVLGYKTWEARAPCDLNWCLLSTVNCRRVKFKVKLLPEETGVLGYKTWEARAPCDLRLMSSFNSTKWEKQISGESMKSVKKDSHSNSCLQCWSCIWTCVETKSDLQIHFDTGKPG